jgi:hypothetical protein
MSRRTQADYELIFRAVVERIGNVEVEGFVADFEVGKYHFKWLYIFILLVYKILQNRNEGQVRLKYY